MAWSKHALLDHVDIVLAQDCGSKSHCIAEMLKFGYAPDHVLMVGDAPSDQDAAGQNGVFFYPILVRHEAELERAGFRVDVCPNFHDLEIEKGISCCFNYEQQGMSFLCAISPPSGRTCSHARTLGGQVQRAADVP